MDYRFLALVTLVVALGSAQEGGPWFECESLMPKDQLTVKESTSAPFAIWTSNSFVARGETLQVTLKRMHIGGSQSPVKSFVVQARLIGGINAIGTWEIQEGTPAEGLNCVGGTEGLNTLSSMDFTTKEQDIVATWRAPTDLSGSIEFLGTFVTPDNKFWHSVNSIEVDLAVKEGDTAPTNTNNAPSVFANGDPHQSLKEAELAARFAEKQMQEIQDEDKNSEGDWQRREEEERRKHEEDIRKEMEMFEKQKADEERQRQERIHMEMLDKEEYDRQAWENEHKGDAVQNDGNIISLDGDDTDGVNAKSTTSGAAVVTSGVVAVIFAFVFFIRRN